MFDHQTNPEDGEAATEREATSTTRCLIADAHPLLRRGVAAALTPIVGRVVATMAGDADELREGLETDGLALIVTDLVLPGFTGYSLVRAVADRRPGVPYLVLSAQQEALYAEGALRAGAQGFASKFADEDVFEGAIRHLLAGQAYASASVHRLVLEGVSRRESRSGLAALSAREHEVFVLLGRGLTRGEIADRLSVHPKTVGTYITRTAAKLGLDGTARLVETAVRWASASSEATEDNG